MKKSDVYISISLYLLIILLHSNSLFAQKKLYAVANIGFYNMENFFDTLHDPGKNDYDFLPQGARANNSSTYWKKVNNLSSVVRDIGTNVSPDGVAILGVAEIENAHVLSDLVNNSAIKNRNYQFLHYESPDSRGIDVAFLYNPKYFKVTTSKTFHVSIAMDGTHNGNTRDILLVEGQLQGEHFYFFVNHWPSRLGGQAASEVNRNLAAGICRKNIDSIQQIFPEAKVVLMGDLNDNPDNNSVTKVLNANDDPTKKDNSFYNPFLSFYKKGIGTLAYQDAWALFDQIILSRNLFSKDNKEKFFFYKANIFKRDDIIQTTGRYKGYPRRTYDFDRFADGYSDHFPTFITILKEIQQ